MGKKLLEMEKLRKTSLQRNSVRKEEKLKGNYVSDYIISYIQFYLINFLINFLAFSLWFKLPPDMVESTPPVGQFQKYVKHVCKQKNHDFSQNVLQFNLLDKVNLFILCEYKQKKIGFIKDF
jgi:hypothetical protein